MYYLCYTTFEAIPLQSPLDHQQRFNFHTRDNRCRLRTVPLRDWMSALSPTG